MWRAEYWLTRLFLRKSFGYYGLWRMAVYGEFVDRDILPRPVTLRAVEAVAWPVTVNPWLSAYAHNVMQRQLLFSEGYGYSLNQLLSLACIGGILIRFYAKAFAWLDSRACVESSDVTRAMRLVERYYTGHQPLFLALFRHLPGTGFLHRLILWDQGHHPAPPCNGPDHTKPGPCAAPLSGKDPPGGAVGLP